MQPIVDWFAGLFPRLLDWLTALSPGELYFALAAAAAIENVFPPFPADTVVAFGSFLAARGSGSPIGSFLATWIGNVAGAMAMYAVGRRFGQDRVESYFAKGRKGGAQRFRDLYGRHGLAAVFITRFFPGVRAVVPPLAGAFRIPAPATAFMIAVASGIWYAVVTFLGYQVGSSWEALLSAIQSSQRVLGVIAGAVVALVAIAWLVVRRRRRSAAG